MAPGGLAARWGQRSDLAEGCERGSETPRGGPCETGAFAEQHLLYLEGEREGNAQRKVHDLPDGRRRNPRARSQGAGSRAGRGDSRDQVLGSTLFALDLPIGARGHRFARESDTGPE